ncbi:uncharacterized protein LOC129716678 [Wyeomyia smithii]|uniref:uncharacterized protein LOC129716678 n=1 Tax=Wyeomyia smithii TaxID=174621 RepID=UPI002467C9AE|nr:uncharacterized protein LOC129716678 [Wyeomyia smithii]
MRAKNFCVRFCTDISDFIVQKLNFPPTQLKHLQIINGRVYVGTESPEIAQNMVQSHNRQHELVHDGKLYRIPLSMEDNTDKFTLCEKRPGKIFGPAYPTAFWSLRGLRVYKCELKQLIADHQPAVIAIQETVVSAETLPADFIGKDNKLLVESGLSYTWTHGVGLAMHEGIHFERLQIQTTLQAIAIRTQIPTAVTVVSIYLPPNSGHFGDQLEELLEQLPELALILGDFNTHRDAWGFCRADSLGRFIAEKALMRKLQLTTETIDRVLINELRSQDLLVDSLDISPATSSGDNYMSDVFRIHVQFRISSTVQTVQKISLVVKCLPSTGSRGSVIEEMILYEQEAEMFLTVIPQLSRIANNEFFAAKCYHATRVPERMLIFQEFKSLNYTMANRLTGLDFDHCALIMRKIGKFHAASMPYIEHHMDLVDKFFHFNIFNPSVEKQSELVDVIFEKGLRTLIEVAESSWDNFDPKILAKLKKLLPNYVSKLEACLTQKFDDAFNAFKVLNHGDLWCNNMLFKYSEKSGKVTDVVFVDFQISFYSSPGLDLNYAIATCPNLATRDRSDELIAIYHQALSETLKSVHYPRIPTLNDVYHEIRRMEFYALVLILSIAMMKKTDSAEASFEAFCDEEVAAKARRIQYSGKTFQTIVKPMLKQFDERKLLDV